MSIAYQSLFLLPFYLYGIVCFWRYSDADLQGFFLLGRLGCLAGVCACLGVMAGSWTALASSLAEPWSRWAVPFTALLFALSVVLQVLATRAIVGEMAQRRRRERLRSGSN